MPDEPARGFGVTPSYDRIAQQYADAFFDELARKPADRALLDHFVERVRGRGVACDIGTGPGQVARYHHERGVPVCGMDLSLGMVEIARQLNPDISFQQGDMLNLPVPDGSWAGITCFYALIHIPRLLVPRVLAEFWRTLSPGGWLLLAVHGGEGELHADTMLGEPVSIDATLFSLAELSDLVGAARFAVEEAMERPPYDFEHQTPRLYLVAQRP
jgi:SAM-dependent methyltransferase